MKAHIFIRDHTNIYSIRFSLSASHVTILHFLRIHAENPEIKKKKSHLNLIYTHNTRDGNPEKPAEIRSKWNILIILRVGREIFRKFPRRENGVFRLFLGNSFGRKSELSPPANGALISPGIINNTKTRLHYRENTYIIQECEYIYESVIQWSFWRLLRSSLWLVAAHRP